MFLKKITFISWTRISDATLILNFCSQRRRNAMSGSKLECCVIGYHWRDANVPNWLRHTHSLSAESRSDIGLVPMIRRVLSDFLGPKVLFDFFPDFWPTLLYSTPYAVVTLVLTSKTLSEMHYCQNIILSSDNARNIALANFSSFQNWKKFSFLCHIFPLSLKNHVDRENAACSDQRLPETLVRSFRNFFLLGKQSINGSNC